jgi:AraC-like DNA-binding protein
MLYLSAITLAFFLSIVLITKRKKTAADNLLTAWLAIIGFQLLTFYQFFTDQQYIYPSLVVLGFPLPLVHGPFLYLYTKQQTSPGPFANKQMLHFLPVLLSYLLFAGFYFLPFDQKILVFRQKGLPFQTELVVNLYAVYASGIVYISLSLYQLLKYRKRLADQFSNTEKINFNWLLYLVIWVAAIWAIVLFVKDDNLIYAAAAIFVLWIGYFGIKQVRVFSETTSGSRMTSSICKAEEGNNKKTQTSTKIDLPTLNYITGNSKYQKSTLNDQDASAIHERLMNLMAKQKPYTNPDLTLNELARLVEVHPNHLSQVINSKEQKSFYDLVNQMRVEEFILRLTEPSAQQFTMLSISYDCGFNSKASFNRNFKKNTGLTPRDYLKQQQSTAATSIIAH